MSRDMDMGLLQIKSQVSQTRITRSTHLISTFANLVLVAVCFSTKLLLSIIEGCGKSPSNFSGLELVSLE